MGLPRRHCCQLAVLGVLLVTAAVGIRADPELDSSCAGQDYVQVPHPKNCHEYLVCCDGKAVSYECLKQREGDSTPNPGYGTAQRVSYYNAFSGKCERFDETGKAPGAVCGNGNPNAGPITSDWADSVCTAKESYDATLAASPGNETLAEVAAIKAVRGKGFGRASKAEAGTPRVSGAARAAVVVLSSVNATAEVFAEAGKEPGKGGDSPAGRRRALLQAPGNDIGAYELIINPTLGRSSTGTLAIHAVFIPTTTKVLLWGRYQPAYEPNMFTGGTPEVSAVYDFAAGTYVKAPMRIAPFCSGHSHLSDGTIVAGGGDWANSGFLLEGRYAVRTWDKDGTAWTVRPEGLAYPHWYPTQLTLPDDRVLHVGGYASEADPPVPSIEIWDGRVKRVTTIYPEPFLLQLGGLNLYPTTKLLPWTNAAGNTLFFVFACNQGRVMQLDQSNNLKTLYATPAWPTPAFCSAFSALGTATILRLDADKGYAPELAMWGGSGGDAGNCACDLPANDNAYRLDLGQAAVTGGTWAWQAEKMPGGRNMVDNVLLPNGKVLLVNGARFGNSNGGGPLGGSQARSPVYEAWLYDPYAPAGARFKIMAATNIKRLYHSVAMLMPDGDVLVMGSEQDECVSTCFVPAKNLQQFQAERFRLPYSFEPLFSQRATITGKSAEAVAMGAPLTVTYTGAVTHAVIAAPAAVTHQTNMDQRLIKLATTANAGGSITVTMPPPGGLVASAGWYMLFLMNGDLPCKTATWVRLTNAAPVPAAPSRASPGGLLPATSSTFEAGAGGAVFAGGAYLGAAATFDFAAGGAAAYSGAAGASVTVTTPGTATWHVQVFGPYVPLSPAKQYTAQFQIRASAVTRITVTWLRDGDFLPFGTTSLQVDTVFKDFRLYNLQPPGPGNYHLQFEFGLAPAGTVFYLDDIQVFDLTLPPSPNPLPPVNADGGVPPPSPPTGSAGTLIPAISEDFAGAAPYKYTLSQFAGAAATASFAGGAAAVTVTAAGTAPFNLQLVSAFVPFAAASGYTARLRASAAAPGGAAVTINVLFLREGTYALLGLKQFFLTAAVSTLELTPPVSPPTDGNYHVQIEFGTAPVGTVLTFDDIIVYNGNLPPAGVVPGAATKIAATSTDFEGAGPFPASGGQYGGAAATFAFGAPAGAVAAASGTQGASAAVVTAGTASYNLQFVGPWTQLTAGRKYTARVQVRATAPSPVTLVFLRNLVYTPFAPSFAPVTVGTAWTTLTIADVILPATAEYHVQAEFGLAAAGTTLYLDNLEVFDTTDGPAPAPPATNPVTPGGGGGGGAATKIAATSTDFEGAGPFPASGGQYGGAAATFAFGAPAGAVAAASGTQGASAAVVTAGTASYNLQFVGPWTQLTAGRKYTARVQVRAITPSPVTLVFLRNLVYTPFAPSFAPVTVGTAWTSLTIADVILPATAEYHVQAEFGLAAAGTTLYFDNLEVFDTTDGPAPAPPATNPVTPGGGGGGGGATVLATTSEDFSGPGAPKFVFAQFAGAALTPGNAAGVAQATVVTAGADQYALQLVGPSVQLDATKTYTISASVTASVATTVQVLFLQEAPILAPVSPQGFAVGPAAKTVTLAGVKPPTTGPHHVQFEFGKTAAGTVMTFDNIVVTVQ